MAKNNKAKTPVPNQPNTWGKLAGRGAVIIALCEAAIGFSGRSSPYLSVILVSAAICFTSYSLWKEISISPVKRVFIWLVSAACLVRLGYWVWPQPEIYPLQVFVNESRIASEKTGTVIMMTNKTIHFRIRNVGKDTISETVLGLTLPTRGHSHSETLKGGPNWRVQEIDYTSNGVKASFLSTKYTETLPTGRGYRPSPLMLESTNSRTEMMVEVHSDKSGIKRYPIILVIPPQPTP